MPCRSGADDDCRCRYRAAYEYKPSVAGSAFYPGAKEGGDIGITFRDINPALELRVLPVFLKDENIPELLDDAAYDFVVDAIDTLAPKMPLDSGKA